MPSIDDFRMHPVSGGASPTSVFRQLVAQGGIKFNFGVIAIEMKEDDLRRIHDIINEVDERRAFYNASEDEVPETMVASIRGARHAIHDLRKGVWANGWAREVVQFMLHDIGEFLTNIEKEPIPRFREGEAFERFEDHALECRLRVWTAIAHLFVVFGDAVKPMHLPHEILLAVRDAYDERSRDKDWF